MRLPISLAVAFSAGCVRFSEIHDQTAPVDPAWPHGARVSAEKCMFSLFYCIPFGPHPLAEAKARAEAKAQGALVDVDVETDVITAVVGMVTCAKVTGTGVPDPRRDAQRSPKPEPAAVGPKPVAPPPLAQPGAKLSVTFDSPGSREAARETLVSWIGRRVVVIRQDGAVAEGTLKAVTAQYVTLMTSSRDWTAPYSALLSVEVLDR